MNSKTKKAKDILLENGYTCVFCNGNDTITSKERGIKPLLSIYNTKQNLSGYSAADRVVGKAAAFVYILLKVDEIYAEIISEPAKQILEKHKIPVSAKTTSKLIRNRDGTGFCPMETAVMEITDPKKAVEAIENTLKTLN